MTAAATTTAPHPMDIQRAYARDEDHAWAFVLHTEDLLWKQDTEVEMEWTFENVKKHGKDVVLVKWWTVKIPNRCDLSLG